MDEFDWKDGSALIGVDVLDYGLHSITVIGWIELDGMDCIGLDGLGWMDWTEWIRLDGMQTNGLRTLLWTNGIE